MPFKKLIWFAILLSAMTVRADYETFNFFGSIGGGFGMGGSHYQSFEYTVTDTTKVTDEFFNYGSGFKLDLGCQYYMMEDIALQASFGYSTGGSFEIIQKINETTNTWTFKRRQYGIKVLVVPRFEALDLIDLYTGVGLGFFWAARPFEFIQDIPNSGKSEVNGKITSFPTIGFIGQFGTNYPVTDKLTVFGELAFEQLRFNLNKYIVKESDLPTSMPTGTRYYSKDDTNPDNLDPEKVPGANFQIRVGVRYALF